MSFFSSSRLNIFVAGLNLAIVPIQVIHSQYFFAIVCFTLGCWNLILGNAVYKKEVKKQ